MQTIKIKESAKRRSDRIAHAACLQTKIIPSKKLYNRKKIKKATMENY